MTFMQYKRLLLVLSLPLIAAGLFYSYSLNSEMNNLVNWCQPGLFSGDDCSTSTWEDLQQETKDFPPRFQVYIDETRIASPSRIIVATQRAVRSVQILSVSPYVGTSEAPGSPLDHLRSLSSQKTNIIFGASNEFRVLDPLGCNNLRFTNDSPRTFEAELCGVPDGIVKITFSADSATQAQLMSLKNEIDKLATQRHRESLVIYLLVTPIFLLSFIALSFVIYLLKRVTIFVAKG